jgi:hypothetical protein
MFDVIAHRGSVLALGLLALACGPDSEPESRIGLAPEPLRDGLPVFPADDPSAWTCGEETITAADIEAFCKNLPALGEPAKLPPPADIHDLEAKNAYDLALRQFLHDRQYRSWVADRRWRLTGPYVGDFGQGQSFGVHPAVRIWYSPEIVEWMCSDRKSELPDGAMIVKEMQGIDPAVLQIDPAAECMEIAADPATLEPSSWTVMVRHASESHDGWYWANPADFNPDSGGKVDGGNPPILDRSAVPNQENLALVDGQPNPNWFPTGDLFGMGGALATMVTPYSQFGAYCVNCHASAVSHATFASLDNVVGEGLKFRHFAADEQKLAGDLRESGAEHPAGQQNRLHAALMLVADWGFSSARAEPTPGFVEFFGALGPSSYEDAFALRLPAETFDHRPADADGPATFLSSNQCIGCHDATVSNDSTPNMLLSDPVSHRDVNVSPYGEWRASPMGLAGRDPIFFSQLQSETNRLPAVRECIESTCLHCHGVMGQRQFAVDNPDPNETCSDLFGIEPPAGVPFGKPFALSQVSQWQGEDAKYGGLARDGISCTVCHRMSDATFGQEAGYTGNFLTGPADTIFGPYEDDEIVKKPMEHSLGITPKHGAQLQKSELCGSCHNILLPVFDNAGDPLVVGIIDGQKLTHSYEQSTYFEWTNSVYAREDSHAFRSCQDCHMPTTFAGQPLTGIEIANIESSEFAPTTERLPDADIALRKRDRFARHSLHGLNLFLNQMFQQFPELLGIRQIDYMGSILPGTTPALVTGEHSIVEMAREQTAKVELSSLSIAPDSGQVEAEVVVENLAGHFLPSGVGFRRVFIEFVVEGEDGELLWASGRTNALGIIVEGTGEAVLATEYGRPDSTEFQPHYELIERQDQVQIYQELVKDSDGVLTTSFLRRALPVKDNRLRPKGFNVALFRKDPSPYVRLMAEELEHLPSYADPDYRDPARAGRDVLRYSFVLAPAQAQQISRITVRLFAQSIPPSYLQQRFADAEHGPDRSEIERLYWLTSHLDVGAESPIADWKLFLTGDCRTAAGERCTL